MGEVVLQEVKAGRSFQSLQCTARLLQILDRGGHWLPLHTQPASGTYRESGKGAPARSSASGLGGSFGHGGAFSILS
jgi:hypothetical protein